MQNKIIYNILDHLKKDKVKILKINFRIFKLNIIPHHQDNHCNHQDNHYNQFNQKNRVKIILGKIEQHKIKYNKNSRKMTKLINFMNNITWNNLKFNNQL